MKVQLWRFWLLAFTLSLVFGSSTLSPSATASAKVFRWDIITFNSQGSPIPGGRAFAMAANMFVNATITLKGSGTFDTDDLSNVTGGGTYVVRSFPQGAIQSKGTFQVTRLVLYLPTPVVPGTTILGGLAVLVIAYSDGSTGTLVVNCAVNSAPQETEGVTATKGLVDYWSIQGGNTLFHVGTTF